MPRDSDSRTSGAAMRTGTAPILRAKRSIAPPVLRSFMPLRSSVVRTGLDTM